MLEVVNDLEFEMLTISRGYSAPKWVMNGHYHPEAPAQYDVTLPSPPHLKYQTRFKHPVKTDLCFLNHVFRLRLSYSMTRKPEFIGMSVQRTGEAKDDSSTSYESEIDNVESGISSSSESTPFLPFGGELTIDEPDFKSLGPGFVWIQAGNKPCLLHACH